MGIRKEIRQGTIYLSRSLKRSRQAENDMKKHSIAIFILAASLCLSTGAAAADLEHGFMGYKWGDDVWQYDGLKELYNKGGLTFYSNPGESYTIEDKTIGNVIYGFYNDKFYAVYINIISPDTYDLILQHMKAEYGLPDAKSSSKETVFTYKWKYKNVTIKLKQDQAKGRMKVAFYHGPTATGLKQERMLQEVETPDSLFPVKKNREINMVPFLESWDMR